MDDLTGRKFNKLTVIGEPVLYGKSGKRRYVLHCKCECGKEAVSDRYAVIHGRIRSCGCHREYHSKEITGRRFGMLVAEERITRRRPAGTKRYMVKCKCDCGNTTETDVGALLRGATTSCGCRRDQYEKLRGANNSSFTGYNDISGHDWCQFRIRARRRNLEFSITIQYAWTLYERQGGKCALTGIPLKFGNYRTRPTASMDRIDNDQGYVEGNIQWVHKHVNLMRGVYTVDRFVEVCLLVAAKQGWSPP